MDGRIGSDFSHDLDGRIGPVPSLLSILIPGILGNPKVSGLKSSTKSATFMYYMYIISTIFNM